MLRKALLWLCYGVVAALFTGAVSLTGIVILTAISRVETLILGSERDRADDIGLF